MRRKRNDSTETANRKELAMPRIEIKTGIDGRTYYCIVVPSPVIAEGIVQGEFLSMEAAEVELKNWM